FRRHDWHESANIGANSATPQRVRLAMFCGIGNRTSKNSQGVMMAFRSNAAICGAVLVLDVSVTAARSGAVHSSAVLDAASGDAIVGAASMYNPFRPGWREGGPNTASGERYDPSVW